MIRYFHPGDEDQLAAQGPIPFDEDTGWWAGVQQCMATVALAATLALATLSTTQAQLNTVDRDNAVGTLTGQMDEDGWIQLDFPNPPTEYQRLPYGSLLDPEELPVGFFGGELDEDYWKNPVPLPLPTEYQQLPRGSLFDPEEIPANKLYGQDDEDFWINPVRPVPLTMGRLYLPDPEEIPAGSIHSPTNEDYWINSVAPVVWVNRIQTDPGMYFQGDDLHIDALVSANNGFSTVSGTLIARAHISSFITGSSVVSAAIFIEPVLVIPPNLQGSQLIAGYKKKLNTPKPVGFYNPNTKQTQPTAIPSTNASKIFRFGPKVKGN